MAKHTQKRTAKGNKSSAPKSAKRDAKVGSDRGAAAHFAGNRDFGIPAEGAGRFTEVAEEAKYQPGGDHLSDPRPARSGESANRESGVGGVNAGPGSSSGGDIDTDFVGVGTHGIGLSESGPDVRTTGPDMTQGGTPHHDPHPHRPRKKMRGDTVDRSGGDATTTGEGMGSGGLETADRGDDAAAGELSQGEAAGDDNTDIDNVS
jgi:hypothetical protein